MSCIKHKNYDDECDDCSYNLLERIWEEDTEVAHYCDHCKEFICICEEAD